MAEQRIAACLIVGDQYNKEEIKTLFESLQDHVHGIFIAYNGKKKIPSFDSYSPKVPIFYKKFKWEDDFSVARNQSFSMVPRDQYEWYAWIDVDDKLVVENSLQNM